MFVLQNIIEIEGRILRKEEDAQNTQLDIAEHSESVSFQITKFSVVHKNVHYNLFFRLRNDRLINL